MTKENQRKPRRVSDDEVFETVLEMCRQAGLAGQVRPEDVARAILPLHWRTMLKRVRLFSKQLAQRGQIVILRKGKPADPDDVKGVIRLRITEHGLVETEERES